MTAARKPLIRRPGKYASRCGQIIEILSARHEGSRTICTGYACAPTSGGHYRRTLCVWNQHGRIHARGETPWDAVSLIQPREVRA